MARSPDGLSPSSGSSGGSSGGDGGFLGGIWDGIRSATEAASDAVTSWSDLALPKWAKNLREHSGFLVNFAQDPKGVILGVLALWLVNSVLDFVAQVMGLVLSAWALVAGIPGTVAPSLTAAGSVAGQPVLGVIGTASNLGLGLISGMGWMAPIVLALLFVALLEVTEEVGWALLPAFSNLLGAIPVVGSLLDAVLTFIINLAGGRS